MFKVFFKVKAVKTLESVNSALMRQIGSNDMNYETMEDIEKAEREGFLEFDSDMMTVYYDGD